MFPRSNDAKTTRHVIKDQLLYQPLLYLCLKAMSCVFYCSHPVPTRLSVFNKQAGQVRRSCCLISLCSTHWGHNVLWCLLPGAPVAEAQPGRHLLPSKGKQIICKPASSWILPLQGELRRSSAGSLGKCPASSSGQQRMLQQLSAESWTKLSISCPDGLTKCSDMNQKQLSFLLGKCRG